MASPAFCGLTQQRNLLEPKCQDNYVRLLIDANLINSAIRNPNSRISRFILNIGPPDIELYAPTYLQSEVDRHLLGISKDTGLSEHQLQAIANKLYDRINFIEDATLSYKAIIQASSS